MAVNLANVNISLNEFQRLSQGEINAGEVRLAGETKLAKMNNHVSSWFSNSEHVSMEETIAIKQAFIKALSQNGVDEGELNRVRRELGLAPAVPVDRKLNARSIKPLMRQQIREILDRNADAINAGSGGKVFIAKSSQLYGPGGMSDGARAQRDAVNALLASGDRLHAIDKTIIAFHRVVAGGGDFELTDSLKEQRDIAVHLLEDILVASDGHPRDDVLVTATFPHPSGMTLSIPTGKNEAEFVRHLEDAILRLSEAGPTRKELEQRKSFVTLPSTEAKTAFLAALHDDPQGGVKAPRPRILRPIRSSRRSRRGRR